MSAPLIYVDLIEEQPMSRDEWSKETRRCPAAAEDNDVCDICDRRYGEYLEQFQPWRLMILSGDNHKDLFRSTERYFNEADARRAADIGFGANSNVYLRQKEHGNVELRLATGEPQ
jgi:hypothetical protein